MLSAASSFSQRESLHLSAKYHVSVPKDMNDLLSEVSDLQKEECYCSQLCFLYSCVLKLNSLLLYYS